MDASFVKTTCLCKNRRRKEAIYACEIITTHVIQGKEDSIHHDDLGKSIATVQVLQRKHETFEREVTALGNKVHVHMCMQTMHVNTNKSRCASLPHMYTDIQNES